MASDSYAEEPTLPAADSLPTGPMHRDQAVGDLINGRYRLVTRIGAGAMGVVWEAHDVRLSRSVALKILHPDSTDADAAARLRHEAKLLAQIEHVNVVRVLDAGLTEIGQPFVVMERVRGRSVAQTIAADGRMPWRRALDLGQQIAEGLAAAHGDGIIHRDLKPANVLVVADAHGRETAKIIDFGLAKGAEVDRTRIPTRTGQVFGTPAYMSPEQVRGEVVDLRTDVYAFGATLFEMLAGRRIWSSPSVVEVLYAQLFETAPLLRTLVPDVPPELEALVARCLAKRAADRFSNVQELRAALHGCGQRGATVAPRPTAAAPVRVTPGGRAAAPSRAPWIAVGVLVAAGAGFAGMSWLQRGRGAASPSAGAIAPAEIDAAVREPSVEEVEAVSPVDDAPPPAVAAPPPAAVQPAEIPPPSVTPPSTSADPPSDADASASSRVARPKARPAKGETPRGGTAATNPSTSEPTVEPPPDPPAPSGDKKAPKLSPDGIYEDLFVR